MLKNLLYLLLLLMLSTGCATIVPVDTSVVACKSEIAVLPVLAGVCKE